MKKILIPQVLIMLVTSIACNTQNGPGESGSAPGDPSEPRTGTVSLRREQFRTAGMEVGDPQRMQFSNQVRVKGYIKPSVSGMAKISTLVPGRVKRIYHSVGDQVSRGAPLFSLEGQEIVALQQEYVETISELDLARAEYERYQALSQEKVVAEKVLQKSQSQFITLKAKTEGLRFRLLMIGLDPEAAEEGRIVSELVVVAPIEGIISEQNMVLGQSVNPQTSYMEIIDPGQLQLELRVFERDIAELSTGQIVVFSVPGRENQEFQAVLTRMGNSIDPVSKTIPCIAELSEPSAGLLVNNLFVEAEVTTCERETLVVPELAVIREAEKDFVWVMVSETEREVTFRKIPVRTGMTREGYTELLEEGISDILLVGAYNLPSVD